MLALTVLPHQPHTLSVEDMPEPTLGEQDLLVEGIALGVCGTDHEIDEGVYGEAPAGADRLIIGHESLGRVLEAPEGSGFAAGDLVVGIVRFPDPEPCVACAHGEWDMCRNGRYTEHGIKGVHGFASQRWVIPTEHAVKLEPGLEDVGMLLEPATVVAKAWEQVERIGARAYFAPKRVLVTGAGPIGLLGALIGVQKGLEVFVLDQPTEGVKPDLVRALGATYVTGDAAQQMQEIAPDVVIEATGAVPVISGVLANNVPYGIVCLTGISAPHQQEVDLGHINRDLVLDNGVIVGSVNANRRHYEDAARVLAEADPAWLRRLISRRVPLEQYADAFERRPDDVKVVVDLT